MNKQKSAHPFEPTHILYEVMDSEIRVQLYSAIVLRVEIPHLFEDWGYRPLSPEQNEVILLWSREDWESLRGASLFVKDGQVLDAFFRETELSPTDFTNLIPYVFSIKTGV